MSTDIVLSALPPATREALTDVGALIAIAAELVVTDHESYETAAETRNALGDVAKDLDARRKELTAPLDAQKAAIMGFFRAPIDSLEKAKRTLEGLMLAHKRKLDEERAEEQRRAEADAKRVADEQRARHIAEAEAAISDGLTKKAETAIEHAEAVRPAEVQLAPVKIVSASVAVKKNWKARIVDPLKVPREFCVPDQKSLDALAKAQKEHARVDGVEFYFEEVMAAKGR